MDLFELTRTLVDIPSVTGEEEAVGKFLASYLEGRDYTVALQMVEPNRFNIIAATDARPRVVFSTHMDTVPPFIPAREDAGNIHGRGACDAKGIIASQITAAELLRSGGVDEVGLLFTVDEEQASAGARAADEDPIADQVEYLINGEPTDNRLATGTKGSLRLKIYTRGRAAHSAYPEEGESAIETLLDVLNDIRAVSWPGDEFFGMTTCNIGVISGGVRSNIIPATAEAELAIRLVTESGPIKQILDEAVAGRAQINYFSEHDPIRLLSVEGFEQCVVRFTTDIPYLSHWGSPLLIGPGSILHAHTDREFITKRDLEEAVDLYARLARTLLVRTKQVPERA